MNPSFDPQWLELLAAPGFGSPLRLEAEGHEALCLVADDGTRFPIRDGIPRFVADEDFSASFGFQWNQFDVRQKEEDEATFVLKTGVPLADLAGKWVLDGGCGGGRYSRVAADHGAHVVAIDRSSAVQKAQALTKACGRVLVLQGDLTKLPLQPGRFDLVFSIGVLHHGPDPRGGFRALARAVRPGGRLSVWLYRRCSALQEALNHWLRRRAQRMTRDRLLRWCRVGAFLGGIPLLNRTLNKLVSFSHHPVHEIRVCDTFDWYSPPYQSHHTVDEITGWFREEGFDEIRELPPAKQGTFYQWAFERGWLIGSGVNVTGVRSHDD